MSVRPHELPVESASTDDASAPDECASAESAVTGADAPIASAAMTDGTSMESSGEAPNRLAEMRPIGWYPRLKFAFVRGALHLLLRSFGLRGLYRFGTLFSRIEYTINFSRRARFRKTLRSILGETLPRARENAFVRRHFRRTRCDKLFYVVYDKVPARKKLSRIRFHGQEHLDAALERGNGVYLAMSHHGSHHIMAILLAILGHRVTGIRDRKEGVMRSYMQQVVGPKLEEFHRVSMLYADDFPREIFRCFRKNQLVLSALDANRTRGAQLRRHEVEIFGEKRQFLSGPIQIAQRCGATILPAFLVSRANYYYRIVLEPPISVPGEAGADDLGVVLQRYADAVAAHLRAHPDHLSRV